MNKKQKFDVIIVGNGITGLSAAYHLSLAGIKSTAITALAPADANSASRQSAGILSGGQLDNFTRVSHAHGQHFAVDFWRFGDTAFDALELFSRNTGVNFKKNQRLRLIVNEHELMEAKTAAAQMQAAGIAVTFYEEPKKSSWASELTPRTIAIQQEERGGFLDPKQLLIVLESLTKCPLILSKVNKITPHADHMEVHFSDQTSLAAEMIVLAAHLDSAMLVPDLASAFVSVAEQWSSMEFSMEAPSSWSEAAGLVFSAHHGYELGVMVQKNRIHFGGGRYLRPLAGIGATAAAPDARIEKHLAAQLTKTFSWAKNLKILKTVAGLENRPCDELPIIGPMFGEPRVLISTGYMGSGTTMGFFAGKCLAELIHTGTCKSLPRRLWPERLRTLKLTEA